MLPSLSRPVPTPGLPRRLWHQLCDCLGAFDKTVTVACTLLVSFSLETWALVNDLRGFQRLLLQAGRGHPRGLAVKGQGVPLGRHHHTVACCSSFFRPPKVQLTSDLIGIPEETPRQLLVVGYTDGFQLWDLPPCQNEPS